MTNVYNKCYYVVATHNGKHYYTEGEFTQEQIDNLVNNFNIDDFINDEGTDEEYCGPAEGMYEIIRQSDVSCSEAVDIGYATKTDNGDGSYTVTWGYKCNDEAQRLYEAAQERIEAEVLAEYGDVEVPYVCQKRFA